MDAKIRKIFIAAVITIYYILSKNKFIAENKKYKEINEWIMHDVHDNYEIQNTIFI